jgi:hypothetical protein
MVSLLKLMESEYSCSGICFNPLIYLFTDINYTPSPGGIK